MKRLIFAIRCFFVALNLMKGGEDMGLDFLIAVAIIKKQLTWAQVTEAWKPYVKRWLDAYGVGTDGNPLPKDVE